MNENINSLVKLIGEQPLLNVLELIKILVQVKPNQSADFCDNLGIAYFWNRMAPHEKGILLAKIAQNLLDVIVKDCVRPYLLLSPEKL